jgi:hypothetical protein
MHVPQLLSHGSGLFVEDRVYHLIGFFQEIIDEALFILLTIPGTSVLPSQHIQDADQIRKLFSRFFCIIHSLSLSLSI